jgi:hypothetical protein
MDKLSPKDDWAATRASAFEAFEVVNATLEEVAMVLPCNRTDVKNQDCLNGRAASSASMSSGSRSAAWEAPLAPADQSCQVNIRQSDGELKIESDSKSPEGRIRVRTNRLRAPPSG